MNNVYQKLRKDTLAKVKEETVLDLVQQDVAYQESLCKHGQAEQRYMEMKKSLTVEQREIVDTYIHAIDQNNSDMNDLLYMAGLRDALRIIMAYGLMR